MEQETSQDQDGRQTGQTPQETNQEVSHLMASAKKPNRGAFLRSKTALVIGLVLLLALGAGAYFMFFHDQADAPGAEQEQQEAAETVKEDPTTIRMLATGDFIAHDAINKEAKQENGTYQYAAMLQPMQKYFRDSDVNFCNQATLAGGEKFGITGYPIFNAPFEWIHDMKGFGCNVINTGTNHTNDKGQGAITSQLDEWDKQNVLAVAGSNRSSEEQAKVRYFEVKGIKFAFVSYSTYSNAPNPNPYSLNRFLPELFQPQLQEARTKADIVIVSMRWGTEYSETINSAQDSQAQTLADLGADIILGHGTHTLQPVKRLTSQTGREAMVWYGLGNFLNAQLETTGLTGCLAQINIDVASKKVKDSMCLPFYQHYEWTAEQKAAEDLLSRKNFLIMPLFNAQDYLAKSQLNTTVEEQMQRINDIVNKYAEIPIINADDL